MSEEDRPEVDIDEMLKKLIVYIEQEMNRNLRMISLRAIAHLKQELFSSYGLEKKNNVELLVPRQKDE